MKIGILWDLDGTLLDTLQDLTDATNHVLHTLNLPQRTVEEVRQFVGNGAGKLMERATEGKVDVDKAVKTFQEYYKAHCQVKTGAYPGVLQALEQLGKNYPMAIVSNKPDLAVKELAGQYFPGLYARGESAECPRKPAPDMVYRAMEALGVERCIYIGDSEVDVATAKNAGVPCLSVLWGFRDRAVLEEAGAEHFCEKPENLPTAVEKIVGEINGK